MKKNYCWAKIHFDLGMPYNLDPEGNPKEDSFVEDAVFVFDAGKADGRDVFRAVSDEIRAAVERVRERYNGLPARRIGGDREDATGNMKE